MKTKIATLLLLLSMIKVSAVTIAEKFESDKKNGIYLNLVTDYLKNPNSGQADDYIVVNTKIPVIDDVGMTSLNINFWGYDQSWELVVGWYAYYGKINNYNAYVNGNFNAEGIYLQNKNGFLAIAIPSRAFSMYGSIGVSSLIGGRNFPTGWEENWTISGLEKLAASKTYVPIIRENVLDKLSTLKLEGPKPDIEINSLGFKDESPYLNYTNSIKFTGGDETYTLGRFNKASLGTSFGISNGQSSVYIWKDRTHLGLTPATNFANSRTQNVQLYGDVYIQKSTFMDDNLIVKNTVSIGSPNPGLLGDYKLVVDGKIGAREIEVKLGSWADYVFKKDYQLLSLDKVEQFITENGHLPNVPSAEVIENNAVGLGELTKIQQEKIEELTLYIIQLNKRLNELEKSK